MSNEFKIEAGKYYRMRNGVRVCVAATNKPGSHNVLGWSDDGHIGAWLPSGKFSADTNTGSDIISEWVEPERIPWEHLPKWCRWWAKDANGRECGYEVRPECTTNVWFREQDSGIVYLPNALFSNYTGDWRNSLRERPEGV